MTGRFEAAGHSRAFPAPDFWSDSAGRLQFLFHLHGFADLRPYVVAERGTAARTPEGDRFWSAVLESWLDKCGTPGRPAWHPYPTSGRIIAWCAALSAGGWDARLERRMRGSLHAQLRLVRRSVEHDIGGNHVVRNGAALMIGGRCLGERATERRALALLRRELRTQILPDGGHEERSPSYHRAVLADLEDVAAVLGHDAPRWLGETIERMRTWLCELAAPDGSLPLLNDSWEGPPITAPQSASLHDLSESGYVVARYKDDQAVLDVGLVAPPHLPAHAHADVLSFVMWADGRPLVVDPGSFTYDGRERDEFRGTAAHNTLELDGLDQCDLWGTFRAAGMPQVRRLSLSRPDIGAVLIAEHDGYRRLPDPVAHRRTFAWLPGRGLIVVDRLIGTGTHRTMSRLHLAPHVAVNGGRAGGREFVPLGVGGPVEVGPGRYAPFFGHSVAIDVLCRGALLEPGAVTGWAIVRPGTRAELSGDSIFVDGRIVARAG